MADFLFLLGKINLAMTVAILVVALLRRPMRAAFHAPVGYALWLLVPTAALASLLPPRVVAIAAHPINVQIPVSIGHALRALPAVRVASFDWTLLLFAGWLVGAGVMALFMIRQQHQFHQAERWGRAGPAVTGFIRPRIVVPAGFAAQFSVPEQAAILAHEKAHLVRQDARINAVVALLRCLCWFNPLIHLGATLLRKDQELACDAAATARVPRIDYANALLKSQMRAMALPLGCSWPGGEHPLTERVALLKRPLPARARQQAGMALVLSLTVFAGVGAWAAQPAEIQPAHNFFVGKFFYSQQANDTGPSFWMTLESADKTGNNVVLHFPYGMAQAGHANFDFDLRHEAGGKTITLIGNVRLAAGEELGIRGNKLVFDARTGLLDLDGRVFQSGMPKYVPCTKDCKYITK